ncbi:YoaK family protein [Mycobacterium sp.]|uniref:YoaK family protein n=1 Tax=Mycobacterium sp. TaxID=1785 RepID=UPI0031E2A342
MAAISPVSERLTVTALLLLTVATGLVDAISVLVLGHVFVANMTGNAIFLGFWFVPHSGVDLTAAVVGVGGFLVGSVLGGRLIHQLVEQARRWLTTALGTEVAVLAVLSILVGAGVLGFQGADRLVLIAALATSFGLQNATARQFGIQELTTTVLTSTIVAIGVNSRLAGGAAEQEKLRYGVLAAMTGGAVVGATLSRVAVAPVIGLAAVVVAASLLIFQFGRA